MNDYLVINENLNHALAAFARVRKAGRVVAVPGLSLVYAGVPYALFNTALVTQPVPSHDSGDMIDLLDRAQDFFNRYNVPWSIWFCEEFLDPNHRRPARIALATRGFKLMMEAPGMIARELAEPRPTLPLLDCRPVSDARTRRDFSRIMSTAFHVPEDMSLDVYSGEYLWQGDLHGWIGYRGAEPISTTAVISGVEAIGLYAVATQPNYQRQGYGESLMRHAMSHEARLSGLDRSILQSSAAGYPLYVRMGYRNVARFLVYVQ